MSTSKRIDFDKYKSTAPLVLSGGVIAESLQPLMCESRQLQDVIANVKDRHTVFWVSEGEWSMHQLLLSLLDLTGPADIMISSYAMGEMPARTLATLKSDAVIKKLSIILDDRVDVRTPGSLQLIRSIADEFNLVKTHAKVTLINTAEWKISVIGSANYTDNKRYEAGIITSDQNAFEFNSKWITKALQHED
jgi:hypothetical protein